MCDSHPCRADAPLTHHDPDQDQVRGFVRCWVHALITFLVAGQPAAPIHGSNVGVSCAGDVKEFGFRSIPDDENYRSYFSAAIPSGEAAESASTPQPATETTPSRASQNAGRRQQNAKGPSKQAADQSSSSWFGWSKKPEPVSQLLRLAFQGSRERLSLAGEPLALLVIRHRVLT